MNQQPFKQSCLLRAPSNELLERTGLALEGVGASPGRLSSASGPLLGRSWALLGASWAPLGTSWACLSRSWAPLGCHMLPKLCSNSIFYRFWTPQASILEGFGGVPGKDLGASSAFCGIACAASRMLSRNAFIACSDESFVFTCAPSSFLLVRRSVRSTSAASRRESRACRTFIPSSPLLPASKAYVKSKPQI